MRIKGFSFNLHKIVSCVSCIYLRFHMSLFQKKFQPTHFNKQKLTLKLLQKVCRKYIFSSFSSMHRILTTLFSLKKTCLRKLRYGGQTKGVKISKLEMGCGGGAKRLRDPRVFISSLEKKNPIS